MYAPSLRASTGHVLLPQSVMLALGLGAEDVPLEEELTVRYYNAPKVRLAGPTRVAVTRLCPCARGTLVRASTRSRSRCCTRQRI